MNADTTDDLKESLQNAIAAATPHLMAAGRELIAAGSAFMPALNGLDQMDDSIEADISVE